MERSLQPNFFVQFDFSVAQQMYAPVRRLKIFIEYFHTIDNQVNQIFSGISMISLESPYS